MNEETLQADLSRLRAEFDALRTEAASRPWLTFGGLGLGNLATFLVLAAMGMYYDFARMVPGPIMWLAVSFAVAPPLVIAARRYNQASAREAARTERIAALNALLQLPNAQLLGRLSEMARVHHDGRITGIVAAVEALSLGGDDVALGNRREGTGPQQALGPGESFSSDAPPTPVYRITVDRGSQ